MQDSTAQQKDMPSDFTPKKLKLTKGNIRVRTRGNLTALGWKDRRDVYWLTDFDLPPEEGNFCDDRKRAVKPQMVARYNRHMGYVDISDLMANSYSMCRRNFKWTTKLFFHLLDLTLLNNWILLSSCGAKCTHQDFGLLLVRNLIEEAGRSQDHPHPQFHWKAKCSCSKFYETGQPPQPAMVSKLHCRVCSVRGQRRDTMYKCTKCNVGLCVVPCFTDYHTKTNL